MPRVTESIEWIPITEELPDEDLIVMVHAEVADGESVWPGYLDAGEWRSCDGGRFRGVTHWAEMLKGPQS